MAHCPTDRCQTAFDDPRALFDGSAFSNIETNCKPETGILLLTDDAGLLDAADPSLGAYLDASNETRIVTSLADVLRHYKQCSSFYWDLQCFFAQQQRPGQIMLGLVQAGETLSAAFTRITKCPVCAATVQVATRKKDGSTWIDTAEYGTFTDLIDDHEDWHHHGMTYQAKSAFTDMFETTSFAYGYAHQDQEWVVSDIGCRFKYAVNADGDCEPTTDAAGDNIQESYYLNVGLTAAGFDAYHTVDDSDYNYTTNSAASTGCHTGIFLDETTGTAGDMSTYDTIDLGALGQGALTQLTGLKNAIGEPITGVTRHLSAFISITNGRQQKIRYLSSMSISGNNYGDVWYKEKAVRDDIRETVLAWKDQAGTDLSQAGQRAEALQIKQALDRWIGRGVINPDIYNWTGYENILVNGQRGNGEGYVIAATPANQLNTSNIVTRSASLIQYCFRVNSPQHGSTLQVCKVPSITLEAN